MLTVIFARVLKLEGVTLPSAPETVIPLQLQEASLFSEIFTRFSETRRQPQVLPAQRLPHGLTGQPLPGPYRATHPPLLLSEVTPGTGAKGAMAADVSSLLSSL